MSAPKPPAKRGSPAKQPKPKKSHPPRGSRPRGAPKAAKGAAPAIRDLVKAMDGLTTAEALNDGAVQPFVEALEDVCRARGYVLNIYGDGANLIVTGDADASEAIFEMVDNYLDARGVGEDD